MGIEAFARGARRWLGAAMLAALAGPVPAQTLADLAQVDPEVSRIDDWGRGIEVTIGLSQPVPWRVFTLDAPRRLVLDFREADWSGVKAAELIQGDNVASLRFGAYRPGWSRLVVDLPRPLEVTSAGMGVDEDGTARVHLVLETTGEEEFAAAAGAPFDMGWAPDDAAPAELPPDDAFVVAIDPGHGGIDPGAEREGLREAHLMLALAQELAEALEQAGMVPVLTREEDSFVSLQERMTLARAAGADVLLSLHADALEEDDASGASIYTLTEEAVDQASAKMVERHEAGDLLAGVDLSGQDDAVATALMDLARQETAPRSERLAATLARELAKAGAAVNDHAQRRAPLAVLNAADFPSVLLETGFLSDASDRERLATPQGRATIVAGVVAALEAWAAEEAERAALLRR